jgi:hypothetical protein
MTRGNATGAPYVDLQLRPSELQAIGHVIAQWAFLEFLILRDTRGLAKYLKIPLPDDAEAVSFQKRRKVWKQLATKALHDLPEELTRTLALIPEIDAAAGERHRLTHDIIEADPQNPNRLKAYPRSTPRKFGWPLDAGRIEKTARRIARINYGLLSIHKDPKIVRGASGRR